MRCHPCIKIYLEKRTQGGSGTAAVCYVAITDEFTETPHYWATAVDNYIFENGDYTVTTTWDPGGTITNDEECGSLSIVSTFDPEFDYGASTDFYITYEDEVTAPPGSAAISAIVWEAPSAASAAGTVEVSNWHGAAISLLGVTLSVTAGETSTAATAGRVSFRLARGYAELPIALHWLEDGEPRSISIPTDGNWSPWVEKTIPDSVITEATLYVGPYIPA